MKRVAGALLVVASVGWTGIVHADAHDDADRLFREGRSLLDAKSYFAACARFAESQRLEPAAGTLLNLADCYERVGRVASAWATYKEALAAATLRKRRDWEKFAQSRIDALAPSVPTLMIRVSDAAHVPGLVVTRDGEVVPASDLDREVPVDPGQHAIVASAPGREPWTTTVDIVRGRSHVVAITPIGLSETARPVVATRTTNEKPIAPRKDETWQRPAGYALGGIGLAAIALGAVSGFVAIGARSDAVAQCPDYPTACTANGTAANERSYDWATVSTIAFVGGALLTATGVVLIVTAPRASSTAQVRVSPAGAVTASIAF